MTPVAMIYNYLDIHPTFNLNLKPHISHYPTKALCDCYRPLCLFIHDYDLSSFTMMTCATLDRPMPDSSIKPERVKIHVL